MKKLSFVILYVLLFSCIHDNVEAKFIEIKNNIARFDIVNNSKMDIQKITFKKKFVEPSAETDTLATVGLEDEYEPIIMAGVAAHMLSGRDIPSATTDYITDQLATQNFPVDSSTRVRNSLLAYQRALIQQARKDLRARYPEPVSINKESPLLVIKVTSFISRQTSPSWSTIAL